VWSGSIIYEWIEEQNDYGLISYGSKVDPASPSAPPDGFPRSGMYSSPSPLTAVLTTFQESPSPWNLTSAT
jgi:hypothetical protein